MQEELQKLKEEFEDRIRELEDKYKTEEEFKPEYGDEYWAISSRGEPDKFRWAGDIIDKGAFNLGNIFRTKEEAEFEVGRLKVLRELEKMGRPYDNRFMNWRIYLDGNGDIDYYCETEERNIYGNYYFRSRYEVIKAVYKISEERIKKYLFGFEG